MQVLERPIITLEHMLVPKTQDKMLGGVSVLCLHVIPVINVAKTSPNSIKRSKSVKQPVRF